MEALCGSGAEAVKAGAGGGGREGQRVSVGEFFSGIRSHCRAEMDTGELPLECFLMLRKEEAWTGGQTCGQTEMAPQVQSPSLPEESVLQAGERGGSPLPLLSWAREADVAVPPLAWSGWLGL